LREAIWVVLLVPGLRAVLRGCDCDTRPLVSGPQPAQLWARSQGATVEANLCH